LQVTNTGQELLIEALVQQQVFVSFHDALITPPLDGHLVELFPNFLHQGQAKREVRFCNKCQSKALVGFEGLVLLVSVPRMFSVVFELHDVRVATLNLFSVLKDLGVRCPHAAYDCSHGSIKQLVLLSYADNGSYHLQ
jgi:hypothetical protein